MEKAVAGLVFVSGTVVLSLMVLHWGATVREDLSAIREMLEEMNAHREDGDG